MSESDLTIDHVLDLEYPGEPAWGPDGELVAATVYEDDGNVLVVTAADGSDRWRFRPEEGFVTGFDYSSRSDAPRIAVTTDAGELLLVDPERRRTRTLLRDPEGITDATFSNAGDRIACYRDGCPVVVDVETGLTEGYDAPSRGPFLGETRSFVWSEDDRRLAYRFVDGETKDVGVIDVESNRLVWRTDGPESNHSPAWIDGGRLFYDQDAETGTVRRFLLADPAGGEPTVLFEEREPERGVISGGTPQVSPDGTRIAATLPLDGFEHVHVFDVDDGDRRQLTHGPFDDSGLAGSSPQWVDDSRLVFASNRRDSGQRQLFSIDVTGGETRPIVESAGTNVQPRPSPDGERIAYVHADRTRSPELRTSLLSEPNSKTDEADAFDPEVIRLTRSRVESWPVDPIAPEYVTAEADDGLSVHGYLLDPRASRAVPDDATDLPAIVYVHGGPMRQMRDGWHPSRSYGLAYAIMQYFAAKGYVGLFVNYRGGIGYGAEFRHAVSGSRGRAEMDDIALLTAELADRAYVDGDRIGVWGLSYGGYATLQMLGTHPDTFAVGVNLAGLADLELYREWAIDTKFPAVASATPIRMGGYPSEAPDEWAAASPVTYFERYEAPLYSFHGTDDDYVNVAQQDLLVDRLLDLDVEFEAEYYPGENHVFARRAVQKRTIETIEEAFGTHLGRPTE